MNSEDPPPLSGPPALFSIPAPVLAKLPPPVAEVEPAGPAAVTPGGGAVVTVHRRVRTGARPTSVVCAGCGAVVPVVGRGPIPMWCGQTCRQRAWELRRAAAELSDPAVSVAVREIVQVPVTIRPERSEWVGELAELTRQIATGELPVGCRHGVYEALTVAINQLVLTDRANPGNGIGGQPHPPLVGRHRQLAAQLDTGGDTTAVAQAHWEATYQRSAQQRQARMFRRFPNDPEHPNRRTDLGRAAQTGGAS